MHPVLRIVLYVVLAATAAFSGYRFIQGYSQQMDRAARRYGADESSGQVVTETTNRATADAESIDSLPVAATNPPSAEATNQARIDSTNLAPAEVALQSTNTNPAVSSQPATRVARKPAFGLYAALTLGSLMGLALLLAGDVSHYIAARAHRELFNDEGEGVANPEYDQAEQAWADGDHLEALRLLREYLNRHPRRLHAAFRIAEIYEKDLGNHLAAALEYEEILKHKLPADRWGWAAIHLCNLYNRLNQPDKTEAMLRRIVDECGDTPAAKKARERLGIPEESMAAAPVEEEAQPPGGPQLPPGFRPKKKR